LAEAGDVMAVLVAYTIRIYIPYVLDNVFWFIPQNGSLY
jgi:hypothetical protein